MENEVMWFLVDDVEKGITFLEEVKEQFNSALSQQGHIFWKF